MKKLISDPKQKHISAFIASYEVSEAALLREIIYIFQGIEGKVIKLDQSSDAYRIDSKLGVPRAVRDLVNKLAELGWLFRKIRKYLDAHAGRISLLLLTCCTGGKSASMFHVPCVFLRTHD